jgi:hypothetical protein
MLELVRGTREHLVGTLGLSRRLAARVGALMSRRIACTAAVLEEARDETRLADLLLAPELRKPEGDLQAVLQELLGREAFAPLVEELPLTVTEQDDWQVIALEEEVEAEAGFAEAAGAAEAGEGAALPELRAPATPAAMGGRPGGDVSAAFSEETIAELRVNVFAGASSAERVSALRRLAYAPMDAAERLAIFIQALAEEDPPLRVAAANGLHALGLRGDVTEAIRLLAEGNEEERLYAVSRLGAGAAAGGEAETRAAVMTLLGTLRTEESVRVREGAVGELAETAPRLPDVGEHLEELLRLLLEQAVSSLALLGGPVRRALLAFEAARPGAVAPYLVEEARQTEDLRLRGYLLGVAARCRVPEELAEPMRRIVTECLLALPAESPAAHGLGSYLVTAGDAGVRGLVESIPGTDTAHQRFLVRLLDNAVRFESVSDELRLQLAREALTMLRSGSRQLLADLFETRLTSAPGMPEELRREMAAALIGDVRQFGLPQVRENVENSLVRLGTPAVPPLLQTIRRQPESPEAAVACRAVGRISLAADPQEERQAAVVREALRTLQSVTFSSEGSRREVFLAMGRLCATGLFDREVTGVIRRNLLNRLEGGTQDAPLIEALGWLAASPRESREDLKAVAGLALSHLEKETPESSISSSIVAGEEVFSFGGDFDVYGELIPACLSALEQVVLSPQASAEMRRDLTDRLLERWRACIAFEVQWSPSNVTQLTGVLGAIGEADAIDSELRVKIIHTLAQRMNDLPVLEALAGVVAVSRPDPAVDRLAAAVAMRLLKLMEEEGDLTLEDREMYLRVLARVASRGRFEVRRGGGEDLLRRVVDELAVGLRDGVPGCLGHLISLRDNERLPMDLREDLAREVREHTSLARRPG